MTDEKDKQGKPTIETSDLMQCQHFVFWHTVSFYPFLKSTTQTHQWHARIHTGIAKFSLSVNVCMPLHPFAHFHICVPG
jgi:hypothetical protein